MTETTTQVERVARAMSDAEPVAWKCQERTMGAWHTRYVDEQPTGERYRNIVPLYAHPPAAEPVGVREAAFRIANMHMLAVGASLSTVDERARYVQRLADEIVRLSAPADHWLEPYRTMDAGGSPETAGQVGHSWLIDIARAEHGNDPAALEIDMPRLTEDGTAQILYRGPKVVAACFIVRDPMNFAILFRYLATPARTDDAEQMAAALSPPLS